MIAARLGMLGVSALVIDKNARTGDSWRLRYHDLVLHDPCFMNAMVWACFHKFSNFFYGVLESYWLLRLSS